jgi:hypothetical protein
MKQCYPKSLHLGSRPITPGVPNPTCPILLEAQDVLAKAHDLQRAMRKLRRSTQRCVTCPEKTACPAMTYFAQAIDTAIRELWQEWGLSPE